MLNVTTNIGRLAPPRCDVVKNSQAAKVQTGFVRIPSLSEPPLRCGKGGIRAKTLVLVWTLAAWEFRHHATTRRRKPPDVCFSGQPLGGVSAFGRNFLKRLRRFLAPCAYPACSLKIVDLGRNWAFFAGVRFARRGRLLFSVVILLYSCCSLVVFKLFVCCLYE